MAGMSGWFYLLIGGVLPRSARGGPSTLALEWEQAVYRAYTLPWKPCRLAQPTRSGPGSALLGPRSSASGSSGKVRRRSGLGRLP
jgi:hypothetical protein